MRRDLPKNIVLMTPLLLSLVACSSNYNIKDNLNLAYLKAEPGKPLVYPSGVQRPQSSGAYEPIDLPSSPNHSSDLEKLLRPPVLLPDSYRPPSKAEAKAQRKADKAARKEAKRKARAEKKAAKKAEKSKDS